MYLELISFTFNLIILLPVSLRFSIVWSRQADVKSHTMNAFTMSRTSCLLEDLVPIACMHG